MGRVGTCHPKLYKEENLILLPFTVPFWALPTDSQDSLPTSALFIFLVLSCLLLLFCLFVFFLLGSNFSYQLTLDKHAWPCSLIVFPFSSTGWHSTVHIKGAPMQWGCHRDMLAWEEGWVSAYSVHTTPGVTLLWGLAFTSTEVGLGTLSIRLQIAS